MRGSPYVIGNLFVIVLMSAGTAAGAAGHNTIFSNDIAKHAVRTSDLANSSVTSKKIKNGTIARADLGSDVLAHLATATGPRGATGPQGPQGPTGPQGSPGANGVSGWERVQGNTFTGGPGTYLTSRADCTAGKKVIGGGFEQEPVGQLIQIMSSSPVQDGSGWAVLASNPPSNGTTRSLIAYAICAQVN